MLLRRLEDEVDRAGKSRVCHKGLGGTQQHGGVPVMAAGVHAPWRLRSVRPPGRFLDGKRVHVGAETNGAVAAGEQRPDYARAAQAPVHL